MNFDFSPEQKMFREQVARALAERSPLSEARAQLEGQALYSAGAWRCLAELGALGAAIPEEYGGLGLGRLELCIAAEEIGRVLGATPFLSSIAVCAETILACGTEDQKQRWLPLLARGEAIGTWADSERPGEVTATSAQTRFENGRLTGVKRPVLDGESAHVAVVLATDPSGGTVLVVVDLTGEGVARRALNALDPSRPQAEITFARAPAERLGDSGCGWEQYTSLLDRAAVLLAFEQIGGAESALMMARDFALQRRAFGNQIGAYQGIKHKLANVYIKNEIARAHAYWGAWAISTNAPEIPLAAATARVSATDAYTFAAQENIQTHGGIGFTWESDCQLFYRRARMTALVLGSVLPWKERIVCQIEHRNAA